VNAVTHARLAQKDEVGELARQANPQFPITRQQIVPVDTPFGQCDMRQHAASQDRRRRGDVAVEGQQVRDLVTPAGVGLLAVARMIGVADEGTILINPVALGIPKCGARTGIHGRHERRQMARIENIIGAQNHQVPATSRLNATIIITRHPQIDRVDLKTEARIANVALQHLDTVIGGAVIEDQQLEAYAFLRQHRLDRLRQVGGIVVRHDGNGDIDIVANAGLATS